MAAALCGLLACAQNELEELERKQSLYSSMDKRCSDLTKEVKLLQEALADYNTVLDKVRRQWGLHGITAVLGPPRCMHVCTLWGCDCARQALPFTCSWQSTAVLPGRAR